MRNIVEFAGDLKITQNHLLAVLPEPVGHRLFPYLEPHPMPLGKALYESGDHLAHVYLPTTAIVSLLYIMLDGTSAEIAVVGNEGIFCCAAPSRCCPRWLKRRSAIDFTFGGPTTLPLAAAQPRPAAE